MRHRTLVPMLVAISLLATASKADIVWGSVQNSAPSSASEHAVLLATGASGTLLTGTVYGLPASLGVQFGTDNTGSTGVDHLYAFSPTELRSNPPNDPDTSLDQITITLVSGKYGDVYFNIYGMFPGTDSASFVVTTSAGTFTHLYTGLTGNDTNNYIFLNATPGDSITSVSVISRFFALQDTHISDTTSPLTTPEPGTLLLASTGLGWLLSRRKTSRRSSLHWHRRA